MGNRVNLKDRHDVFAEDINHISDLLLYEIIERYQSMLAEEASYVIKGLEILPSATRNAFGINVGFGVDNRGEMVVVPAVIDPIQVADTNVGAISVVTLSYRDLPGDDPGGGQSPLDDNGNPIGGGTIELGNGIQVPVTPRPQVGKDEDDPINQILPTRIYGSYIVHVETLAVWNALSADEQAQRIKLKKIITPPTDGVDPGFVDPDALEDPDFPTTIIWNLPPNSVPSSAVIGFDEAITFHQQEAHVNFIFGEDTDTSLLAAIDGLSPSIINISDVLSNRSYYVNGKRYVADDLTNLSLQFNPIADASGIYTIYVRSDGVNPPTLEKGIGITNSSTDMPIATVTWNVNTASLSGVVDIRNFLSVSIEQAAFQFLGPLLALFGNGYFLGVAQELLPTASPLQPYDVQIASGAGLARDNNLNTSKMIDLPGGALLSADPPDAFPQTDNIAALTDSGDALNSIVYQLNTNGTPPHKIRNVVATLDPGIPLTETTHYVVDYDAGTVTFKFFAPLVAGSAVTVQYEYALPRKDIIVMNVDTADFSIVKGTASQNPVLPILTANQIEWGVLTVREFAEEYLAGDVAPGSGYIALPFGFNYAGNNLGLEDLYIDLGDSNGVTGENIPSTSTQTINQRFDEIDTILSSLGLAGPTSQKLHDQFRVNWQSPIDLASLDRVRVGVMRRFNRRFKDLSGIVKIRFTVSTRDNIPDGNSLMFHLKVVNHQNNQDLQQFSIPSENCMALDQDHAISVFHTVWYQHDPDIEQVRFEMFVNNSKETLNNTSHSNRLNGITAELLELYAEAWIFTS